MAEKVKSMLSNMVVCVLVLGGICLVSVVFSADFKIKGGAVEEGIFFGDWMDEDSDANSLASLGNYKATSDGFVCAYGKKASGQSIARIYAYTDSNSSPTTKIFESSAYGTNGNPKYNTSG